MRALTDREREVLTLIGQGLSDNVIGDRMQWASAMVAQYRASLAEKLGARDHKHLVLIAVEAVLVTDETDPASRPADGAPAALTDLQARTLLANVHLIAVILDVQGRIVFANDFLLTVTGWSRDELTDGEWFERFLPENTRDEVRTMFLRTILTGETPRHYENPIITRDGQLRHIRWSNTILRDADDTITATASIGEDVTDLKRAEASLLDTQALLAAAIEQSPAGILIAEAPDVTIRIANAAALGIRGDSLEPLIDIPADLHPQNWQTFHLDGTPYEPEKLPLSEAVLQGKTAKNVQVIIRRPSGEDRWVLGNAAPVRNAAGEIVAGVVVFPDITELKRAEEALRRQAESERRLLDELDHRVRNNLAALVALVDVTRRASRNVDEFAETMRSRTQVMATMHSLLAQSKWQSVSLRELLRQLVHNGTPSHVHFEGPDVDVPPGQAQAVGIIINELSTNSAKYGALHSEEGLTTVMWEARPEKDGIQHVQLSWQETGGPPISETPAPGGGTNLMIGLAKSELRGGIEFTWPREGARHTLRMTLEQMATAQFRSS